MSKESPPFFASFNHAKQPNSFAKERPLMIGDAAHSVPPHQCAGASQAIEDIYVLAEVLGDMNWQYGGTTDDTAAASAADERERGPPA
jgi:salicylate hydroxylase